MNILEDKYKKYKKKYQNEKKRLNNNKCSRDFCRILATEEYGPEFENFAIYNTKIYNWEKFDYPIQAFYNGEGNWKFQGVIGKKSEPVDSKELLDYNKFEKVFFFRPGINDGQSWIYFVKHLNGMYIYFQAACDYTGFDCQGCGEIIYDRNYNDIWNLGLTESVRNIIMDYSKLWF